MAFDSAPDSDFRNFDEFWPYYLRSHRDPINRRLHALGTTAALLAAGVAVAKKRPKLLGVVPLLGYGPAWLGHFALEKNRPATFKHPLWSLRADMRMLKMMANGELRQELAMLDIVDAEILSERP